MSSGLHLHNAQVMVDESENLLAMVSFLEYAYNNTLPDCPMTDVQKIGGKLFFDKVIAQIKSIQYCAQAIGHFKD